MNLIKYLSWNIWKLLVNAPFPKCQTAKWLQVLSSFQLFKGKHFSVPFSYCFLITALISHFSTPFLPRKFKEIPQKKEEEEVVSRLISINPERPWVSGWADSGPSHSTPSPPPWGEFRQTFQGSSATPLSWGSGQPKSFNQPNQELWNLLLPWCFKSWTPLDSGPGLGYASSRGLPWVLCLGPVRLHSLAMLLPGPKILWLFFLFRLFQRFLFWSTPVKSVIVSCH